MTREVWRSSTADAAQRICLPLVHEKALVGLKFSDALAHHLAVATLSARLADVEAASLVLREPHRLLIEHSGH